MPTFNSRFLYFLLCVALITGCNRCKEECDDPTNPECPNYCPPVDPCEGINEVSADFIIEERVENDDGTMIYRATSGGVLVNSEIHLMALQNGLSYQWNIGADVILNQDHYFYFPEEFAGQTIPIQLIVEGPIDSICNPTDNGMDTITKYITVYNWCDNPIYGTYKVAWDSAPQDSFILKVICDVESFNGIDVFVSNFTNTNQLDSCATHRIGYGYSYLKVNTNLIPCDLIRGEFWINSDDSFEAEYQFDIDPEPGTTYGSFHAQGRRVN